MTSLLHPLGFFLARFVILENSRVSRRAETVLAIRWIKYSKKHFAKLSAFNLTTLAYMRFVRQVGFRTLVFA